MENGVREGLACCSEGTSSMRTCVQRGLDEKKKVGIWAKFPGRKDKEWVRVKGKKDKNNRSLGKPWGGEATMLVWI